MRNVAIIGSTGSIGKNALEVCADKEINVVSVSAASNYKLLAEQAIKFGVKKVCIYHSEYYKPLKELLSDTDIEVLTGEAGLLEISSDNNADMLLNSVVGMVGLKPTLAAIEAGKTIALANKETLVAGGTLVMKRAAQKGVSILPVDSEHSAVFQCLEGRNTKDVSKLILTASGGPFFGKTEDELKNVSVADALNHPNWSMGNKITIDSATLMNKGFEVIEAAHLFGMTPDKIDVVIHRESIIHSMIELNDGAVIAELGVPDMKIPIQLALTYPEREKCSVKRLDFTEYSKLTFYKPDRKTFKCLDICMDAFKKGGLYPAAVNGANEEAVSAFLQGKCKFLDIPDIINNAVSKLNLNIEYNIENIYGITDEAKHLVKESL